MKSYITQILVAIMTAAIIGFSGNISTSIDNQTAINTLAEKRVTHLEFIVDSNLNDNVEQDSDIVDLETQYNQLQKDLLVIKNRINLINLQIKHLQEQNR